MKPFILYYFGQMQTKIWWAFLVFIGFYCLVERQQYEGEWSVFILKVLTDQYLIIYLMTPVFIQCVSYVYREPYMVEVVRVRKFYRMMLAKWIAVASFSTVFVVSILMIASLFGIGLDVSSTWDGTINDEFKALLMEIFHSPNEGVLITTSFLVLGYTFIGCTFVTVAHYFSRKGAYGFVIVSYLVMIIAFKMPWLELLTHISISRFIILHHNFAGSFSLQGTLFIVVFGLLVQFVLVKKWWYTSGFIKTRQPVLGKGMFRYYARILFARRSMIIWLVSLLVIVTMKASWPHETLQDFIVRFFYGYPNGNIHPFTWLEQLIYIGIPVYLFAVFLQGWLVKRDWPLYIRMRDKRRLVYAILSLIGLYALVYVLLTFVLIVGGSALFDKKFVVDGGPLLYVLCMKMLEISMLLGLMFLLFVLTNRVTLAFISIIGLFVLNYLPFQWTNFNLAGIGQLARIEEMSMFGMIVIGVSYLVIITVFISYSNKKYFQGR